MVVAALAGHVQDEDEADEEEEPEIEDAARLVEECLSRNVWSEAGRFGERECWNCTALISNFREKSMQKKNDLQMIFLMFSFYQNFSLFEANLITFLLKSLAGFSQN